MAHDFKNYPELTNKQMELYYFESPHKQITESFICDVIKVHDGDTITVKWQERDFNFQIRLAEMAAPELNEPNGKASQQFLEQQILGEEVFIEIDPKNRVEKWGRLLGKIYHRGLNIGLESINSGHATSWKDREAGTIKDFRRDFNISWPKTEA